MKEREDVVLTLWRKTSSYLVGLNKDKTLPVDRPVMIITLSSYKSYLITLLSIDIFA